MATVIIMLLLVVPECILVTSAGVGDEAQALLHSAVGGVAGSVVVSLSVIWVAVALLSRCDLSQEDIAMDRNCGSFSWVDQGFTVEEDLPTVAKVMAVSSAPYFLIQGPAFAYRTLRENEAKDKERVYALGALTLAATCCVAFLMLMCTSAAFRARRATFDYNTPYSQLVIQYIVGNKDGRDSPLTQRLLQTHPPQPSSPSHNHSTTSPSDQGRMYRVDVIHIAASLVVGTSLLIVFSRPFINVVTEASIQADVDAFYWTFAAFALINVSTYGHEWMTIARNKQMFTTSLVYCDIYSKVCLINTLVLTVLMGIIYSRTLSWEFSSEVLTIILAVLVVTPLSTRKTVEVWRSLIPMLSLPCSVALVVILHQPSIDWV